MSLFSEFQLTEGMYAYSEENVWSTASFQLPVVGESVVVNDLDGWREGLEWIGLLLFLWVLLVLLVLLVLVLEAAVEAAAPSVAEAPPPLYQPHPCPAI